MKTPKEFDYDLWRDEAGRSFIRVKRTGEVCEVNEDTFRMLRSEEKKLRREMDGIPVYGNRDGKSVLLEHISSLSLDTDTTEDGRESAWVSDDGDTEDTMLTYLMIEEFKQLLTEVQCDILENCLLQGISNREFARDKSVNEAAIRKSINLIRKKAKNFFDEGTQ